MITNVLSSNLDSLLIFNILDNKRYFKSRNNEFYSFLYIIIFVFHLSL